MKILYIARTDTYRYYREGINPSHWLYGPLRWKETEMKWSGRMRAQR